MYEKNNNQLEPLGQLKEDVSQSIDSILQARNQLDQIIRERFTKDVSVMFTDICGYTKFMETRGNLAGRAMLKRHNEIVITAIESMNGIVIKTIGDAVMAMFHKSSDAVAAAVAVQEGLYAYNQKADSLDAIHVKIGIHHGQVLMDESDIFGDAVNLAARIQALAGADEILLSQNVHNLVCVSGKMDCSFLGAVQVKGKSEPQNIYRLLWSEEQKHQNSSVQVRSGDKIGVSSSKEASSHLSLNGLSPAYKMPYVDSVSSIHIDISVADERLILSCFEHSEHNVGSVRVYQELEFKADHISELCSFMVNILNLVNRRGVFPSDGMEKLRQTGQEIRIALFTPKIMSMIEKTNAEHLILLLDEKLIHIPWELIHDGKQFLCRRFNMGRVIKTKQNVQSHKVRDVIHLPLKMLIIADPENNLQGAYKEGAALEQVIKPEHDKVNLSHPRENITAKFVLDHIHYYDWVHFAGHAQYDVDNPEMNGWCLSDGAIHAKDIMSILQERSMPAFIFSNSCQSARSESERVNARFQDQIYSMANALLLSGVHHYIGTFWEIQDDYSREFAMTFYQEILAGKTIGNAVKAARQIFVEAHGEDAIVWASYLLYGDPRVCYINNSDSTIQSDDLDADDSGGKKEIPEEKRSVSCDIQKINGYKKRLTGLAVSLVILVLLVLGVVGYQWNLEQKINKMTAETAAYINQGKISFQAGGFDEAEKYFEQAIQISGSNDRQKAEAFMGLGRIASAKGNADAALGFYEQASQYGLKNSSPQQRFEDGRDQSNNMLQNGDVESSAQTKMAHQQAQVAQALVLTAQGRYKDALALFNKVRAADQDNLVPASLIRDIEQRISIGTNQEKQKRIKELVASLLADKEKSEFLDKANSQNNLSDKDESDKISTNSKDRFMNLPLTMWIMDFETTGYALQEGQPQLLAAGLAGVLLDSNHVSLVERAMLDKVLEELNLGKTSLISRDTALSIGKLMAARTMLSGQMVFTGGEVQVSLRLIETETGQIVLSVNRVFGGLVPVSIMADELGKELSQKLKTLYPLEKP
ncbi:MAG: CHAT domain-containing protein [Desulfamplus sp.]